MQLYGMFDPVQRAGQLAQLEGQQLRNQVLGPQAAMAGPMAQIQGLGQIGGMVNELARASIMNPAVKGLLDQFLGQGQQMGPVSPEAWEQLFSPELTAQAREQIYAENPQLGTFKNLF